MKSYYDGEIVNFLGDWMWAFWASDPHVWKWDMFSLSSTVFMSIKCNNGCEKLMRSPKQSSSIGNVSFPFTLWNSPKMAGWPSAPRHTLFSSSLYCLGLLFLASISSWGRRRIRGNESAAAGNISPTAEQFSNEWASRSSEKQQPALFKNRDLGKLWRAPWQALSMEVASNKSLPLLKLRRPSFPSK